MTDSAHSYVTRRASRYPSDLKARLALLTQQPALAPTRLVGPSGALGLPRRLGPGMLSMLEVTTS
jgi:hypothetical protein